MTYLWKWQCSLRESPQIELVFCQFQNDGLRQAEEAGEDLSIN